MNCRFELISGRPPAVGIPAAANSQDFGTSRWQLMMEHYTNFPRVRKGARRPDVAQDKAVECLVKDRDALLAFYNFPAEHWKHLRKTNVIESSLATTAKRT
jgi:hypothetical protein